MVEIATLIPLLSLFLSLYIYRYNFIQLKQRLYSQTFLVAGKGWGVSQPEIPGHNFGRKVCVSGWGGHRMCGRVYLAPRWGDVAG